MRLFTIFFLAIFWAVLPACTGNETPVFGDPVVIPITSASNVAGPRFSSGPAGKPVLSWMERGESGATLRYSMLQDGAFTEASDVVTDPGMFVNWADLPSVMPVSGDHWIAHWLSYSADETYAYDVVVSQSFDTGTTWSEPVTAHTDGTPTEHGFVSMYREKDGVALLWLDGRNTPDESMTLRSAVITPEGERIDEQLVDDSVCDCCQTDIAIASSGPVAVYRDRTADEIRDIYVTRFTDDRWQPGVPLYEDNWHIPGCPVNGPSIVASGDQVAVAWFSAANDVPTVRVVISDDGGATFAAPVEIASGRIGGYVSLVVLGDKSLAASWVSRNEDGSNALNLRRVTSDGLAGPVRVIGQINQLRVFPQLAYHENNLFLAWTDEIADQRQMKATRIPVSLP